MPQIIQVAPVENGYIVKDESTEDQAECHVVVKETDFRETAAALYRAVAAIENGKEA